MKRLAVALGVAVAVAAGAAWWLREPAEVAPTQESQRVVASAKEIADVPVLAESPVDRRLDELRTMSESVRNGTFVIAIRDAGFVCEDVVDVYAGVDAPAWRARCRDSRAYYVRIADAGELAVEPTLDYFDSVGAPRAAELENRQLDRRVVPLEPSEPRR